MVEVDLINITTFKAISKVRELGYFQSPAFENNLPVKIIGDMSRVILDKVY